MPVGSVTMGGGGSAWIELDDIMSRAAVSRTATALVVVVVLADVHQLLILCRKVVLKLAAKANIFGWQSNNDAPGLSPTKESPRSTTIHRMPRTSDESFGVHISCGRIFQLS